MKNSLFVALAIFFSLNINAQSDQQPLYKRFPTLPPLKLLLLDSSTTFTEKQLKKNQAVFVMLFNPECSHCQKETEELIRKIDKFKKIQIVMATSMPFDQMKSFYEEYKLSRFSNIIVGQDKSYLLPTFYQIRFMPFLAFYNKKGNLIDVFEGDLPMDKVLEKFEQ